MTCKINVDVSGRAIALKIARELGSSERLIKQINRKDCFGPVISRCLQIDRETTIKILNRMAVYSIHPKLRHYLHMGLLNCDDLPESVIILILSESPDWTVFWLITRHDNTPASWLWETAKDKDPDKQREAIAALEIRRAKRQL